MENKVAIKAESLAKGVRICADRILSNKCWDRVDTFTQTDGSIKVQGAVTKTTFLVLTDGTILNK